MIGAGSLVRLRGEPLHVWRVIKVLADGRLKIMNPHSHERVVRANDVEEVPDAD